MKKNSNILLADDHPIVLAGLRMLVMQECGYDRVLVASCIDEARTIVERESVQVAVVDLELGEDSGMSLVDILRKACPLIKIVIYTMHEELWVVRKIMNLNVDAVVTKGDNPRELITALHRVEEGRDYFSPRFFKLAEQQRDGRASLSCREIEVLRYIADGMTSADVARHLNISDATVEFHRHNLMRKLRAGNVVQLVRNAMQMGLRFVRE